MSRRCSANAPRLRHAVISLTKSLEAQLAHAALLAGLDRVRDLLSPLQRQHQTSADNPVEFLKSKS
jgi:hypothetical protein